MSPASLPPLAGLRVLDLSRLLPGGYATQLLADLGAEVVKVEQPGTGDHLRWMPPYAPDGQGAMHLALNRGKRSLALDLKAVEGPAALLRLCGWADVVVESFRPGVLDRLGVGAAAMLVANPLLVVCSISGFGSTGPSAQRAGHDLTYLARAGVLSFTGSPVGGPWQPGVQVADLGGAQQAVIAVLAALRVRDAQGTGQHCEVSLTDAALSWAGVHVAAAQATGSPPRLGGEVLNGGLACYRVYACAGGGHVAVGALEAEFFQPLVAALGRPELAQWQFDPERQPELAAELSQVFASRGRDEWVAELAGVDCCLEPVLDLDEAIASELMRARGMAVELVLADGSVQLQVGVSPRLLATPGAPGGPPSRLGADTDGVLGEAGWSSAEIIALRASGALG